MLLADLDLSVLPSEVITTLIAALKDELERRSTLKRIEKAKPTARKFSHVQERFGFRTYEEEISHLFTLYSSTLSALPKEARQAKLRNRLRYLPIILAQDWTSLFPHANTEEPSYYVYAHIDPRKKHTPLVPLNVVLSGEPFYIGKGSGQRAWDLKRNQGHGKRLQRLRVLGYADTALVSVLVSTLTEQEALIVEAKLIYFFGSIYDETILGCLLNLADHARPAFVQTMCELLYRDRYYHDLHQRADVMEPERHRRKQQAKPS